MRRLQWIDNAKAMGIILVVIGHMNRGLMPQFHLPIQQVMDHYIYAFHMPLFFFLSGFLVNKSIENPRFLQNKLSLFLWLYVLWSLLQGLTELLTARLKNTQRAFHEIFNLFEPVAQFWFLVALLFIFVFYYLLVKAKLPLFVIFLISVALYYFRDDLGSDLHINYLTFNFIYFVTGVLFSYPYKKYEHLLANPSFFPICAAVCFLSVWILNQTFNLPAFVFVAALSGILAIILLALLIAYCWNIPWFTYLGKLSLVIYLCHIIFGSGSRVLFSRFAAFDNFSLLLILTSLAGTVLPVLFYQLCRKLNINLWLFRQ